VPESKALVLLLVFLAGTLAGQTAGQTAGQVNDEPVVFRSDVSLVRVDAQVIDGHNRTITGLRADDFILKEDGKPQPIRNYSSENMPIDILLLLDVSASMRPHVERISNAAHEAMRVLADNDRVGIMTFDTYTRLRLPFRTSRSDISRGLSDVLNQERFNGGTHITHALMSAADYVQRNARPEARRAIVILTDDGSQDARNDAGVERALSHADAVLSFLQAPDYGNQLPGGIGRGGGSGNPGRTGTTWPGGGWPGSGPVILGGGGGRRGGRGYPGGGMQSGNHSAGTADIARESGGDTFPVDDASALEDTLSRLRQRYALHYNSADTTASSTRTVQVDLTDAARHRYPDAEIRYRRVFLSKDSREAGPVSITRAHPPVGGAEGGAVAARTADRSGPSTGVDELVTPKRRRMGVDQSYGSSVHIAADEKDEAAAPQPQGPPKQ
jgi:Mg-chelatase subunit ChlD